MTGFIVINKPTEFTSFDVAAVVRGITGQKKIGHTGTLDPMATGVLPLLLGRATKASDLIPDSDKAYVAGFKFGVKTNTGDIWGEVKETSDKAVLESDLLEVIEEFKGEIMQIPPMYSAVSIGGQRLYKLARQGIEIEREAKKIYISELKLNRFSQNEGEIYIKCSKGTYIRTLIEDIAQKLGTVGTMNSLVRVEACGLKLEEAMTLDDLRALKAKNELQSAVKPVEILFEQLKSINVSEKQQKRFLNGGELSYLRLNLNEKFAEGERLRVYGDKFLGLAEFKNNSVKCVKSFIELPVG